jgi:hypothetical protein
VHDPAIDFSTQRIELALLLVRIEQMLSLLVRPDQKNEPGIGMVIMQTPNVSDAWDLAFDGIDQNDRQPPAARTRQAVPDACPNIDDP